MALHFINTWPNANRSHPENKTKQNHSRMKYNVQTTIVGTMYMNARHFAKYKQIYQMEEQNDAAAAAVFYSLFWRTFGAYCPHTVNKKPYIFITGINNSHRTNQISYALGAGMYSHLFSASISLLAIHYRSHFKYNTLIFMVIISIQCMSQFFSSQNRM